MPQIPLDQLSPSQIVLLREEAFARRWEMLELISDIRVSPRKLGETLVEVALLACASQGILELQVRPRKAFFGLGMDRALFAEPRTISIPWTESTLEAWVAHLAVQLQPEERHRVQTLVYVLLREDSSDPWLQIVDEVQGGLVALGILERIEERRPNATRRERAQVAVSVADSVASLPANYAQELLRTCRLTTPQLWRLLRKEILRGIRCRRKVSEVRREDYHHGFG
jgi:hypothetical protein